MLRRIILLAVLLPGLSACTQLQFLPYLDQALTLKEFGEEKKAQHQYVRDVHASFDKMLAAIDSGDNKKYKDEHAILHDFGQPIIAHKNSDGSEQWLYRYAILRQAKQKAYLSFDSKGNLIKWEVVPCPSFL